MTKLERGQRVKREVPGGRFGPLVVEMKPEGLYVREKGRKTAYGPLSWESLFVRGADLHARLKQRKRKARGSSLKVGI